MKKFTLVAAIFAAISLNVQAYDHQTIADLCNFIDFQAEGITSETPAPTSTSFYTTKNGSVCKGYYNNTNETEAEMKWNVKEDYNTTVALYDGENFADSIIAGTMFRAASGGSIELAPFVVSGTGVVEVYYQPNGDSERGVNIKNALTDVALEYTGSGVKIDGKRPCYKSSFQLEEGSYYAGQIIIKVITNTSNIFGVNIVGLDASAVDNVNAKVKAQKIVRDGQVVILKNGVEYNVLGAKL